MTWTVREYDARVYISIDQWQGFEIILGQRVGQLHSPIPTKAETRALADRICAAVNRAD